MTERLESVCLSESGESVRIIDQTRLPGELIYLELHEPEELYEAIYSLRVRGAPAIGIFAAYALYVLALRSGIGDAEKLKAYLRAKADYLASSRPTAVNLTCQLKRMLKTAEKYNDAAKMLENLRKEARAIHDEDIAICTAISEHGLALIKNGDGILTHCNAGALATSRYGTGLGPLILGAERGMEFHAYCDETRPLLQGARLTAFELMRAGVCTTVICDNMAASVMAAGKINACFVGCDRVAMNGDAANKIGTLGVAVLAKHFGIPFYVFCPSTTIDPNCKRGADIVIEERNGSEIGKLYFEKTMTPDGVGFFNPAFDVTPAELITAIITEDGVLRPPYDVSLSGYGRIADDQVL